MENIISAVFREGQSNVVYTKRSCQYNKGVKLRISGIALPERYQVHFANDESRGVSTAMWVSGSDVPIPDAYFENGEYIYVWIYFSENTSNTAGASMYRVIIPIEKRPAIMEVSESSGDTVIGAVLDNETHTLIFHK